MKKLIRLIKVCWLKIRPTRRLYPLGTLGFSIHDDRTPLEKISDRIDNILSALENRYNGPCRDRHIWHSYFDIGLGDYISSYQQIKKIEKEKGWAYLTPREIHEEAKKGYEEKKRKSEDRTRIVFDKAVREISQGRSFVKETKERIKRGEYQIGSVGVFNGR